MTHDMIVKLDIDSLEQFLQLPDLDLDPRLGEGVVVLDAVQHLGHAPEAVRLDVPPHGLVKLLELDVVPGDVSLNKVLKTFRVKAVPCLSTGRAG